MLRIPTKIAPSPLEGIGLFTRDKIAEGELVWIFDPRFDLTYRRDEIAHLPRYLEDMLWRYCYIDPHNLDVLVICMCDARHLNFGNPANLRLTYEHTVNGQLGMVAARDIKEGEELTVPHESDADAGRKLGCKT